MRSIWNGTIAFSLVAIPIKLYSATEDHDLKASQVHAHDHGKIQYRKVCTACEETVSAADIAKLYEYEGQVAILTDEDLATLPSENNRVIDVLEFVPANSIDPLMYDKPYFIAPDGPVKAYVLLARTLASTDKIAVVRFSLRSKTCLGALKVTGKNEVMVIHTLRWSDELREPAFPTLDKKPELSAAELELAAKVVDSLSTEFNPDRYRDTYREELKELVMSKLGDAPESNEGAEEVADLLTKLEASMKAREGARQCKPGIRDWAKSQGIRVGNRGRIPKDVVDQYERATA